MMEFEIKLSECMWFSDFVELFFCENILYDVMMEQLFCICDIFYQGICWSYLISEGVIGDEFIVIF